MKTRKLLLALVAALLLLSTVSCGGNDYYTDDYEEGYTEAYDDGVDEEEVDEDGTDEEDDGEEDSTGEPAGPVDETACGIFLGDFFGEEGGGSGPEVSEQDEETILVTYQVNGDEISDPVDANVSNELDELQQDAAAQQAIWDYFIHFMPAEQRATIAEFIIFTDGTDNVLAAVDQLSVSPEAWTLEIDIADAGDKAQLTYSLLHEFAHIFTLANTQFTTGGTACATYQTDQNCTRADSYLNLFYQQFWTEIAPEWETAYAGDSIEDFYEQYSDQFVTDYAATDPDEDIAETWLYFIISPQPTGDTIAEQKILFFYDFPEMVSLREQIHQNLCSYLMDQ